MKRGGAFFSGCSASVAAEDTHASVAVDVPTVMGVTKKRRIKHNRAAQNARKSQRRAERLPATHDSAPGPGLGSGGRRPNDT